MANTKKDAKTESNVKVEKKSDMKKVKYDPVFDTATEIKAFDLSTRTKTIVAGQEVLKKEPRVKGLPETLIVTKGEVVQLTKDQYNALKEIGYIETENERAQRKKDAKQFHAEKGSRPQYGVDPELAQLYEFRALYNDVLVDCG